MHSAQARPELSHCNRWITICRPRRVPRTTKAHAQPTNNPGDCGGVPLRCGGARRTRAPTGDGIRRRLADGRSWPTRAGVHDVHGRARPVLLRREFHHRSPDRGRCRCGRVLLRRPGVDGLSRAPRSNPEVLSPGRTEQSTRTDRTGGQHDPANDRAGIPTGARAGEGRLATGDPDLVPVGRVRTGSTDHPGCMERCRGPAGAGGGCPHCSHVRGSR